MRGDFRAIPLGIASLREQTAGRKAPLSDNYASEKKLGEMANAISPMPSGNYAQGFSVG